MGPQAERLSIGSAVLAFKVVSSESSDEGNAVGAEAHIAEIVICGRPYVQTGH